MAGLRAHAFEHAKASESGCNLTVSIFLCRMGKDSLPSSRRCGASPRADPTDPGAIASVGVFGVPTLSIDEQLFWGNDSVDFAAAYLHDPGILDTEEMRRIDSLPVAAARR
jgi:hypothetical protein